MLLELPCEAWGAPRATVGGTERGELIVDSGARLLANAPPFDLRQWSGSVNGEHRCAPVAATPDIHEAGDSGSPSESSLTRALRFLIHP